jgi:hypothetical protein
MQQWVRLTVAGVVMLAMTLMGATAASAQTREGFLAALAVLLGASGPTDPSPSAGGAGLSSRDQKVARLLYQAQRPDAPAPRLTLEQISARKGRGESWGDVLKDMKTRGLVSDRSLLHALAQASGEGLARGSGIGRSNSNANAGAGKPVARPVNAPVDDETGDGQKLKQ